MKAIIMSHVLFTVQALTVYLCLALFVFLVARGYIARSLNLIGNLCVPPKGRAAGCTVVSFDIRLLKVLVIGIVVSCYPSFFDLGQLSFSDFPTFARAFSHPNTSLNQ